jgi:hypothetical protein
MALTAAQHQHVSRTAKELSLFNRLSGVAPTRPRLKPGAPEFTAAARRDYELLLRHFGKALLPASFHVRVLGAQVAGAVAAFAAQHRAPAEVALNTIDGHRTYQVQVGDGARTQVLLLGPRAEELARGVVRGAVVRWHWG